MGEWEGDGCGGKRALARFWLNVETDYRLTQGRGEAARLRGVAICSTAFSTALQTLARWSVRNNTQNLLARRPPPPARRYILGAPVRHDGQDPAASGGHYNPDVVRNLEKTLDQTRSDGPVTSAPRGRQGRLLDPGMQVVLSLLK